MELLRLPTPLRRCLLSSRALTSTLTRPISTDTYPATQDEPPPLEVSKQTSVPPITSTTLNSYTISIPPTPQQLQYASSFFHSAPPKILYSAAFFRSFPASPFPEVAFLGRSNVGKSSLLNALFGRTKAKDAHVSKRPGRTRTMNGFGVSGGLPMGAAPAKGQKVEAWRQFPRGGMVVVDMPGYGAGSREIWGKEALKFLEQRKQLRRTFVLVDASHGLKRSDITVLTHLRRKGISHQIVLSKVDKLLYDGNKLPSQPKLKNRTQKLSELCGQIRQRLDSDAGDGRQSVGDILSCSAEKTLEGRGHRKIGIDEVRWAALSACGMESDAFGQRRRQMLQDVEVLEDDV